MDNEKNQYMKIIMDRINDFEKLNQQDVIELKDILFSGILDKSKIFKEEELTTEEEKLNYHINQMGKNSKVFPFGFLRNIKLNKKSGTFYQAKTELNSEYILSVIEPLLKNYGGEEKRKFYEFFFGETFYQNSILDENKK